MLTARNNSIAKIQEGVQLSLFIAVFLMTPNIALFLYRVSNTTNTTNSMQASSNGTRGKKSQN